MKPDLKDILENVKFDLDEFEATDTEGYCMEGIVIFENTKYYVYVSAYDDASYEEQIASQIYETLYSNENGTEIPVSDQKF